MSLSLPQINDICLVGHGSKQCRYLESINYSQYYCKKKSSDKDDIDELLDDFIKTCRDLGDDPRKAGHPMGDNCSGYRAFKTLKQGYDLD